MSRFQRLTFAVIAAVALLWQPLPAPADTADANAMHQGIVVPAKDAIKEFLIERKREETIARPQQSDDKSIAQMRPVGEVEAPISSPQFPQPGLKYTFDFSTAWSFGKTGAPTKGSGMQGGIDANLYWTISRYQRAAVGYYELQEYPVGFDTGIVPVYLQGVATPIATQDLSNPAQNVMVKNKIFIASFQNMFVIAKRFPIIVSPTWTSRWGTIGGGTDLLPIEINGFPAIERYRTVQWQQLAVTVPFLATPKFFGTASIIPWWNTGATGANVTNHMQVGKIGYLEYNPTSRISAFFEPSLIPSMLPIDPYPEHLATLIYGASYNFTPLTFIQAVVSTGAATNVSPYGVTSLTCQALPCNSPSVIFPSIGGLHAAQFQLKFGIGTPSVLPL